MDRILRYEERMHRQIDWAVQRLHVYQMAKRLAVPMHFDTAQVQAGVLVFWLLPSFCSALCLLAAPRENRGIA